MNGMQSKTPIAFVLMVVLFSGCTVTKIIPFDGSSMSIDRANAQVKGHKAIIRFDDGGKVKATDVAFLADSLRWTDEQGRMHRQPLDDVARVYYDRMGRGAIGGMVVGLALGLAVALTPSHSGKGADGFGEAFAENSKPAAIIGFGITSLGLGMLMESTRRFVVFER